ncbi:rRNA-processing protein UTP23-like protein [Iris pallida]|uniref:rRNA-processing protein UTP23-like protein n=1 Tax=Iris pallida TaxID=29817 RepID=A0AAX6GNT1_IRIPA|nr:rRNA-processing protein UTP23-like protein [Iris pallida]
MRVKKQKRHRKIVRFYSACFGSGSRSRSSATGPSSTTSSPTVSPGRRPLSHLLSARALLFTTACAVAELKTLGNPYSASLSAAHQLVTARCDHEKRVSAAACIESVVAGGNSEHFFVATQDGELRRKFREVPGVPVIYGLRNTLFLEQPSMQQREFVKSTEEKRLHMSESEYQKLHKIKSKDRIDSADLSSDHEESEKEVNITHASRNNGKRRMLGVSDKSKFKRKRAKGPNPLSCKKKKTKDDSSGAQNHVKDGEAGRKRKRSRKPKKLQTDSKPET